MKFPVFKSHKSAICYHCGRNLDQETIFATEYPVGQGHYKATCPTYTEGGSMDEAKWRTCDRVTYYDLQKEVNK
jgi:hypothetical protein